MIMRKAVALTLALGVSLGGVAWAREGKENKPARAEGKVQHQKADTVWNQVREQEKLNAALLKKLRERLGAADKQEAFKQYRAEFAELKRKMAKAQKNKDQAALQALKAEMEALHESAREAAGRRKTEAETRKAKLEAAKQAMASIEALRSQEREIMQGLKPLMEQRQAAEQELRTARQTGDVSAATAALTRLMQAEQQAQAKGREILAIKQQIHAKLQDLLNK